MDRRSNTRNPSPDRDENALDTPETTFSHAFILRTLLELLKKSENSDKSAEEGFHDREGKTVELDEELECKLCSVWDMSMDPNIADLLRDSNFLVLFKDRIELTSKPRLWEILIGIVGNVLCSPHGGTLVDEDLWEWLLSLCSCRDSQTLIQVVRCLKLCAVTPGSLTSDQCSIHVDDYKLWDNLAFILKYTNNHHLLLSVIDFLDTLVYCNCKWIIQNLLSNGKNLLTDLSQFECDPNIFNGNESGIWTFRYHLFDIFQCLSSFENNCNVFDEYGSRLRDSITVSVLKPFRKILQEQKVGETLQNHDIWCLAASLSLLLWLEKNHMETAKEQRKKILREIKFNFEKIEFDNEELKHICYDNLIELTE